MSHGPMPRPTPADVAAFDALLPRDPDVTRRPMFGNLAGFVSGQMFLCLLGERIAVRLDDAARAELLARDGAEQFEPMPGRPMREYVVMPAAWREQPEQAAAWVNRSCEYARALPPKPPRSRR